MTLPPFRYGFGFVLWTLLQLGMGASEIQGQGRATLRVEENLRAEPQGVIVGRLEADEAFPLMGEGEDRWVQVEVEGWIWTRSLQATDRLGFDLVVAAQGGENLRAEPSGKILGRMVSGTLLERVEEVPGWTRVRRVAWLWRSSVEVEAGSAPAPSEGTGGGPPEERWWRAGPGGTPILTGPDGDTLARANPGAELRLLAREGNWVRVRIEGWSWAPEGEGSDSMASPVISSATPAQVAADPEGHRGRVVTWELRFVSLERAEKVRTDFYEGEPFLLARTPSPENAFVYVAVPPERMGEVAGLIPLERIRVVGRIRNGAAALTGNPILDLLELTRLNRR